MHLAKISVDKFLHEKRSHKSEKRECKIWKAAERKLKRSRPIENKFGRRSLVLEMMADRSPLDKNLIKKGKIFFTIPSFFSVIDSPEQAISSLRKLAQHMLAARVGEIFLDFRKLSQYDLGANGLLDVLVDEMATQSRLTKRKIHWRGTYPADPGHRRFVKAMGVIKRLKISHEYPSREEEGKLALFDARCKHYIRVLKPKDANQNAKVTQEFSDHIDKCLESVGRKLIPEARSSLCQYVSEIIDNAEEHAGMLDWSIQGYLDTNLKAPLCEIVIFNFGKTIAQSFEVLPKNGYTYSQINKFIEHHRKSGFFRPKWRVQDLLTLVALQGHVSSKNTNAGDTRGNGTVELIDFFQGMHKECCEVAARGAEAKMAIVSGSTYILFDGKYKMEENEEGVKIIAFNDENDLLRQPDTKYVRQLNGVEFPGTLIGIKFPLSTAASTVETGEGT